MNDIFKGVIAFGIVCGMIISALAFLAKASDVEEIKKYLYFVEMRLDQKIVGDQLYETKRAIREIEERNVKYTSDCASWPDARDRDQYKKLKDEQHELELKREKLMKK